MQLLDFCQESSNGMTNDPVTIFSVSTVLGEPNTNQTGSISGGTYVYITVSGID